MTRVVDEAAPSGGTSYRTRVLYDQRVTGTATTTWPVRLGPWRTALHMRVPFVPRGVVPDQQQGACAVCCQAVKDDVDADEEYGAQEEAPDGKGHVARLEGFVHQVEGQRGDEDAAAKRNDRGD